MGTGGIEPQEDIEQFQKPLMSRDQLVAKLRESLALVDQCRVTGDALDVLATQCSSSANLSWNWLAKYRLRGIAKKILKMGVEVDAMIKGLGPMLDKSEKVAKANYNRGKSSGSRPSRGGIGSRFFNQSVIVLALVVVAYLAYKSI